MGRWGSPSRTRLSFDPAGVPRPSLLKAGLGTQPAVFVPVTKPSRLFVGSSVTRQHRCPGGSLCVCAARCPVHGSFGLLILCEPLLVLGTVDDGGGQCRDGSHGGSYV